VCTKSASRLIDLILMLNNYFVYSREPLINHTMLRKIDMMFHDGLKTAEHLDNERDLKAKIFILIYINF